LIVFIVESILILSATTPTLVEETITQHASSTGTRALEAIEKRAPVLVQGGRLGL
jgi:hypothetical protein